MPIPEQIRQEKIKRFREARKDTPIPRNQKRVEDFWLKVIGSLDTKEADAICKAYKKFIVGSDDYETMTRVHANKTPAKEDYRGFYAELKKSGIISPSPEEFELLSRLGFSHAGLIGLIDECHISSIASQITANMIGSMYS